MMNIEQVKKSMPLFLIVGIVVLCAGFFIMSCGTKPQQKVETITGGAFAVDFTECTAPGSITCRFIIESDTFKKDPNKSVAGKELTIEAWIKNKATSTLSGGIFGRMDNGGIILYAKNDRLKAAVRRELAPTGTTDYIVSDTSNVSNDWTHVAAVLVNKNHTSTASHIGLSGGCTSAKGETPHLDLYVNGTLVNCASTSSQFATEPGGDLASGGSAFGVTVDGVSGSVQFEGIIDEARLWGIARTPDEIRACMDKELGLDGTTCGRVTNSLISYFRFNEGDGATVNDWSGLGTAGKEYTNPNPTPGHEAIEWLTGWTTDTPGLSPTD